MPCRGAFGLFLILTLTAAVRAEDVHLKDAGKLSGEVKRKGNEVEVSWPFGSVRVPSEEVVKPAVKKEPKGPLKAYTEGAFRLRYALVRTTEAVRARTADVRVTNRVCYLSGPTARLEEHERAHKRINDMAAARMDEDFAHFSMEGAGLKEAEKALLAQFHARVREVEDLHRAWDDTHKVH